jgi:hypothetical protein
MSTPTPAPIDNTVQPFLRGIAGNDVISKSKMGQMTADGQGRPLRRLLRITDQLPCGDRQAAVQRQNDSALRNCELRRGCTANPRLRLQTQRGWVEDSARGSSS